VEGTESFDHSPGIDPDYFSLREEILDDPQRFSIVRILKHRNDNNGIPDIEIGITRRVTLIVIHHGSRHGELHYGEGFSALVRGLPEDLIIVMQGRVICISDIRFIGAYNG
jgi:hypothetical protein